MNVRSLAGGFMTVRFIAGRWRGLLAMFVSLPVLAAQGPQTAFTPFQIAGNVYYVGTEDHASYLISTTQGLILINSGFEATVPLIEQSVSKLGFKFSDIKILLISHAHIDHVAGSAAVLQKTGAKYIVMDADVDVVESGGKTDFHNGSLPAEHYPSAKVDRVLHDRDTVELGGQVLTAHLTAGHTKGCTTWTLNVNQDGQMRRVLILCGYAPSAGPGGAYQLLNNSAYPQIVSDFERTFSVLPTLPVDIFLGAHGRYFNLQAKYRQFAAGNKNAFVDPAGYQTYVASGKQAFENLLQEQREAASRTDR